MSLQTMFIVGITRVIRFAGDWHVWLPPYNRPTHQCRRVVLRKFQISHRFQARICFLVEIQDNQKYLIGGRTGAVTTWVVPYMLFRVNNTLNSILRKNGNTPGIESGAF